MRQFVNIDRVFRGLICNKDEVNKRSNMISYNFILKMLLHKMNIYRYDEYLPEIKNEQKIKEMNRIWSLITNTIIL